MLIALDLEFNQPSDRIVQIGAAVGNLQTGEVVDTFMQLVAPGEPLAPHIATLCGLTPEAVAAGLPVLPATQQLFQWCAQFPDAARNPLTWGGGDSEALRLENVAAGNDLAANYATWPFGRRWTDAKTVFQAWRTAHGQPPQAGLARAMTKLGLAFVGRQHDAKDDAVNTFRIYHRLLQEFHP